MFWGVRSRLFLLLMLAVVVGGFFFLFEHLADFSTGAPRDLLTTNETDESALKTPSIARLLAVLVPAMCVLLGIGMVVLIGRRLKGGQGRWWPVTLLGAAVAGLMGLGVYLAVGGAFGRVDYGGHVVETDGIAPLGLSLLAAFIVTVGVVGVANPRFLPIPLLAWFTAALVFGMFGSNAIYGINLFKHPSVAETSQGYSGVLNVYWQAEPPLDEGDEPSGRSGLVGQPKELGATEDPTGLDDYVFELLHGSLEDRYEAVSELAANLQPELVSPLIQALGDRVDGVSDTAASALSEALRGSDAETRAAVESALVEALGKGDWKTRIAAEAILSDTGASMTPLENGGALVQLGQRTLWAPGTTAMSASRPQAQPVFEVGGAGITGYLRTDVGDIYTGRGWLRLDPVELGYPARTPADQLVNARLVDNSDLDAHPRKDPNVALLPWPEHPADDTSEEQITVSGYEPGLDVPAGSVPITIGATFFDSNGRYRPFSGTFSLGSDVEAYSWTSRIPRFTEEALMAAERYLDPDALALPESVPERVRLLAEEVTENHDSVYEKARALAWYLRANYDYAFAPDELEELPEGRDSVDRFLFDTGRGTAGEFSSAFVVLARSLGIPARVVSGWVVNEDEGWQTVYSDQAHQWAEVAFQEIGWKRFDPTPIGGAPYRAPVVEAWQDELGRLVYGLENNPDLDERLNAVDELVAYSDLAPDPLADVSSPLMDALAEDEAFELRAKAAFVLGDGDYENATDALVTALQEDDSEVVRSAAAEALAKLGGDNALRALMKALRDDDSPGVRGVSIGALVGLGDPRALGALVSALSDPNAEVRQAATVALRELGATVTELEDGGLAALVPRKALALSPGPTTAQSPEPPHIPLFNVQGAGAISYLRTAVGDRYQGGRWTQLDPAEAPFESLERMVEVAGRALSEIDRPDPPGNSIAPHLMGRTYALNVRISPIGSGATITAGVIPTSLGLRFVYEPGVYMPYSGTIRIEDSVDDVVWRARAVDYSEEVLAAAEPYEDLAYTRLPEDLSKRIGELAREITDGHEGTYAQAKAIQAYLRESYTYAFARPGDPGLPPGADPVDWFLFESRQGTSGQFSSAFVVLARSVGIPARVLSGWTVGSTDTRQTVFTDHAHQWAEVAFSEIGWVPFEPTVSGAPSRTPGFDFGERDSGTSSRVDDATEKEETTKVTESAAQRIREKIKDNLDILEEDSGVGLFNLEQLLGDTRPGYSETALKLLGEFGASISTMENGASLLVFENQGYWVPGTTTAQAAGLAHNPIFQVHGAGHTNYLRTAVGDVYQNGRWTQLHPVGFWIFPDQNVPDLVRAELAKDDGEFSELHPERLDPSLLAGFQTPSAVTHTDVIRMTPIGSLGAFPDGPLPTSLHVQSIDTLSYLWTHRAVLVSSKPVAEYTWTSKVPQYSEAQLRSAAASSDPTYIQLPDNVPDRVRQLAEQVTRGYSSPYQKARALERYLSTTYPYAFADSSDDAPPPGRDPVDWFLFDHREGTCGVFSSAFVVMARSVDIPARVVSGWAIAPHSGTQTVYTDQGHQWAEVALDGLGWITFEPTASGGAPTRVIRARGELVHSAGTPTKRGTFIEIDQWPRTIRKGVPFSIGGYVQTLSGAPVDGIEVDLFINEEKENGGWRLGSGPTSGGRFQIDVTVPVSFEGGDYQLIAHAVGNDDYEGSWSDPEIGVYSGTELEFIGPSEISVDAESDFKGRLMDESGDSMAGRFIQVSIDGEAPFQITTGSGGEFSFTRKFRQPGARTVGVTFRQDGHMLANEARLEVNVTMPTVLSIDSVGEVRTGNRVDVQGALRDVRGKGLSQQQVNVILPGGTKASAETDIRGKFRVTVATESPGTYGIEAFFDGNGLLEPSKTGYTLNIVSPARVELSGDKSVRVGDEFTVRGTLKDGFGKLLPLKHIQLVLPGGVETYAVTAERGDFQFTGLAEEAGKFAIEASFAGDDVLSPGSAGYTLSVTEPVILELTGDIEVQVGEEFEISGALFDSRGEPLPGRLIDLALPQRISTSLRTNHLGRFEFTGSMDHAGRYEFAASFAGDDLLEKGRSEYTLAVVELADLVLVGDSIVGVGAPYRLGGTLYGAGGMGLEGQPLIITADGKEPAEVTTGPHGSFIWETTFDEETEISIRVRYGGTYEYAPIQASLSVHAATAELVVEDPEPVVRGEDLLIRGIFLISGQNIPNAVIQINGEESGSTNAAGVFVIRVPVSQDAPLGEMEWTVSAVGLDSQTMVSTHVMSRTGVLVTPLNDVKKGHSLPVEAYLLNDQGVGIPNVTVSYGDGKTAVTDELGVALLTVDIPDEDSLTAVLLKVGYDGDEANLPVAYLTNLQIQSGGSGWVVWVLLPLLLAAGVGMGYLGSRRFGRRTVSASAPARAPSVVASGPSSSDTRSLKRELTELAMTFVDASPDGGNVWQVGEEINVCCTLTDASGRWIEGAGVMVTWVDSEPAIEMVTDRRGSCSTSWTGEKSGQYQVTAVFAGTERYRESRASKEFELRLLAPTRLAISFDKPADDLPPIWGVGEAASVDLALLDNTGQGLEGRSIELVIGDTGEAVELITDETGRCRLSFPPYDPGEYGMEAWFEGDEGHLPSRARGRFEIVEFRDDVVQRYNSFLAVVRPRVSGISLKATPREVEAMVVNSGMAVDQRALEELIARFEEADYSEHEITRRQFEAAYRAWRRLEMEEN